MAAWYEVPPFVSAAYYSVTAYAQPKSAMVTPDNNIERLFAVSRFVNSRPTGYAADYPIPSLDLTTRPKQEEIVQYADYSQRAQGPYSFTWGFRVMKSWVFSEWLFAFGFQQYSSGSVYAYDINPPVWSIPVTVMTLDTYGTTVDDYRCFQGTLLRPRPNLDYKPAIGGNYENVLFRFVGCTEIFA